LLPPHDPAGRTRHRHRPVPDRVVTVRVPQAPEEVASLPGTALGEIAAAALRTLHAERHGAGVLALRVASAREELPVAPGLDHHRRAAFLALLVRRPVGPVVLLERRAEAVV